MGRVLVIDDESNICDLISLALSKKGHEVNAATSGTDGISSFQASVPDVVLLDMTLPDMSGTEVAQKIRQTEKGKTVPILLMTGKGTLKEEIDTSLFTDLLSKPFSIADLVSAVQKYSIKK